MIPNLPHLEPERLDTKYGRHYQTKAGIFPSVTTVLSATKDRTGLEAWEKRVGAAKAEEIRNDACERGTWVHAAVESWLDYQAEPEYHFAFMPWWNSVSAFLPRVSTSIAMESAVFHPYFQYAGTIDLLAVVDGQVTLVDWKTSGARKRSDYLHDYWLQLGAYTHAAEQTYGVGSLYIERGILVIALPDEEPQIVEYERKQLDDAFALFKERLRGYWELRLTQP